MIIWVTGADKNFTEDEFRELLTPILKYTVRYSILSKTISYSKTPEAFLDVSNPKLARGIIRKLDNRIVPYKSSQFTLKAQEYFLTEIPTYFAPSDSPTIQEDPNFIKYLDITTKPGRYQMTPRTSAQNKKNFDGKNPKNDLQPKENKENEPQIIESDEKTEKITEKKEQKERRPKQSKKSEKTNTSENKPKSKNKMNNTPKDKAIKTSE